MQVMIRSYNMETQGAIQASANEQIKDTMDAAGYPFETHYAETEDGYILAIHRIPHSLSNGKIQNKPVVFLQHGILSCSLHYTTQGPGEALAYVLADQGYDVWMGNARGNTFSRNHVTLSPQMDEFWDFSWNEIGFYDLPTMIDYVLKYTDQQALNYIGHSQGVTSFFVMTSTRPEYNKKIKTMHGLSPVVYISNITSPMFRFWGPLFGKGKIFTNVLGSFEFMAPNKLVAKIAHAFCKDGSIMQKVFKNVFFLLAGSSPENMNATLLSKIWQTLPAGGSINQFIHFGQMIVSGNFCKFDFGMNENLTRYGSITPPDYDLTKVTAPVHLYYSQNDLLMNVKDVQILASHLPNVVFNKLVPHPTFNHFDFLWGILAYDLVYTDLIDNIKRFT